MALSDVNGDGHPDLVVANFGTSGSPGNTASVLLGNGDGSFQAAQNFNTDGKPNFVAVADVNGDGRPDLITANFGSTSFSGNDVSVLLGNGNGTFIGQVYTIEPLLKVLSVNPSPTGFTATFSEPFPQHHQQSGPSLQRHRLQCQLWPGRCHAGRPEHRPRHRLAGHQLHQHGLHVHQDQSRHRRRHGRPAGRRHSTP